MKRLPAVSAFALALLLLQPMPVFANMAAPKDPDVGSSITFERNDALAVTEEVLDITVTGSTADITAAYSMTNVTNETVSTPVMFLAPNTGDGSVEVIVDGEVVPFSMDTYTLSYYQELGAEDWRYAMLNYGSSHVPGEEHLVGISFQLDFEPGETGEVVVSYPLPPGGLSRLRMGCETGRNSVLPGSGGPVAGLSVPHHQPLSGQRHARDNGEQRAL